MRTFISALAGLVLITTSGAMAQQSSTAAGKSEALSSVPSNSVTVTNFYKQNVYDKSDKKIGQILDVLVGEDGKINALVIGAGGFLGMGKRDVVVPFSAVQVTKKDNKPYLVMDTTKDALKAAPGFAYDRTATTWKREERKTEGSSPSGERSRRKR